MRLRTALALTLAALLTLGVGLGLRPAVSDDNEPAADPATDLATLVDGNNAFAVDLYHRLRSGTAADKSLLASPYSVSTALAMTATGARGDTADEMAAVLHQKLSGERLDGAWQRLVTTMLEQPEPRNPRGEKAHLTIANQLWGQDLKKLPGDRRFRDDFLTRLERVHRAPMQLCDFASDPQGERQRINDWVAERTQQRIKDLLQPEHIDDATRLVLTNAIWFKAAWANAFKERLTRDESFTTLDGEQVTVKMMHQTETMKLASGTTSPGSSCATPTRRSRWACWFRTPANSLPSSRR